MPFYKDMTIFTNMLVQDEKFCQSILALLAFKMKPKTIAYIIHKSKIPLLAIIYCIMLIRLLFKNKFNFKDIMKRYNVIMIIFIFLCLTTFQKWYVLWLFPTMLWQNRNMKNFIINLTIMGIVPAFIFFLIENDSFNYGIYYSITMLVLALISTVLWKTTEKGESNVKISFSRWK